jgi:hypothetical protein
MITPTVAAKAGEVVILTLIQTLVRNGHISEPEALRCFQAKQVTEGTNQPHEVGRTLALWGDTMRWLFENDRPGGGAARGETPESIRPV